MPEVALPTVDSRFRRAWVWRIVLLAHFAAAICWWWLMPGGFGWFHVRFGVNRVVPLLLIVACATGLYALWRRSKALAVPILIGIPTMWTAMLVSAAWLFPASSERFVLPASVVNAALWLAYFACSPARWVKGPSMPVAIGAFAAIGIFVRWSQRADDADTRPLNVPFPNRDWHSAMRTIDATVHPSRDVAIYADEAEVIVRTDHLTIEVWPLLRFDSRSPDRCWTLLAPPADRDRRGLRCIGAQTQDDGVWLRYSDEADHLLTVRAADEQRCAIDRLTGDGTRSHDPTAASTRSTAPARRVE